MDSKRSKPNSPELASKISVREASHQSPAVPPVPSSELMRVDGRCVDGGWFTRGSDFCFYATALRAHSESEEKLPLLKLQAEERQLLLKIPVEAHAVIEKLKLILEDREKHAKRFGPRSQSRSVDFGVRFSDVVFKLSGLIRCFLPDLHELSQTFGMLMILFNAVVTKRESEESLMAHLESLSGFLPMPEAYQVPSPTNAMKLALSALYAKLVGFLDAALLHYRSGRLSKLVDVLLFPAEAGLKDRISQLHRAVRHLNSLRLEATEGQSSNNKTFANKARKGLVTNTPLAEGQPLTLGELDADADRNFRETAVAIATSMELLNDRVAGLESKVDRISKFATMQYAQSLQNALSSSPMDVYWEASDSVARILSHRFRLAPKDQWETNGILENLTTWSQATQKRPFMWIGGQTETSDTWVTGLSVDLVQALLPQPVTLLYVFCSDLAACSITPTPMRLVKGLINQLLAIHPQIAYDYPLQYNAPRFQHAGTFRLVWQIFESLAERLPDVFILVDRIEECVADEQADPITDFLPALTHLLRRTPGARAIVTSIYEEPEELMSLDVGDVLESVYIDTSRPRGTR